VLDLKAGVHLQEVEVAVGVQQKFYRPGVGVVGGAGRGDRGLGHPRAQLVVERGRGGFLDELLVAPLDGTLALEEVYDVAPGVREDLELDVARLHYTLLDVNRVVAEGASGFAARLPKEFAEIFGARAYAHTFAAAPGRGLYHHRPAYFGRRVRDILVPVQRGVGARYHRYAGRGHRRPGALFVARGAQRLRRRPDEREARLAARLGEVGVLGQEAVARVDGLGARAPGDVDNFIYI